ncbi:hypothetical protein ACI4CU_27970, partial [Klebsiella pneumoniae]|uniref:hypothetical protein n=1 Tax=Klebsiella pneumoniae TaxID=573 RepID=UPI003852E721
PPLPLEGPHTGRDCCDGKHHGHDPHQRDQIGEGAHSIQSGGSGRQRDAQQRRDDPGQLTSRKNT